MTQAEIEAIKRFVIATVECVGYRCPEQAKAQTPKSLTVVDQDWFDAREYLDSFGEDV